MSVVGESFARHLLRSLPAPRTEENHSWARAEAFETLPKLQDMLFQKLCPVNKPRVSQPDFCLWALVVVRSRSQETK